MTPEHFRRLALALPDAVEGAHHDHPDFRVRGRIFASLHPGGTAGMVKVPPAEQARLVRAHGAAFAPANGAWGRQGCTTVHLAAVDAAVLRAALAAAWQWAMEALPAKPARVRKGRTRGK
ncbi:MAG: MmcQ/YjbR family DNA-binding protein [Planctomycetes bacterium]|nr:MmcQ/YjbR family DNA-binding protein [Planctomycetota bacterium]